MRDLRPEVRQALERAEKFLGLAALVAVLLAAVAVALAASRYLRRHLDAAAMMRCFGAPVARTLTLFVIQFLVLGAIACLVGLAVALAGQQLLVAMLSTRVLRGTPCTHLVSGGGSVRHRDAAVARIRAAAARCACQCAAVACAAARSAASACERRAGVSRRNVDDRDPHRVAGARGAGRRHHDRRRRGAARRRGADGARVDRLLKRLPQRGVSWRFGLANLRRRPFASSLQIGALALGLMALLLLTVVRGDLMRNWRASLPPDAPNQFLINVASGPGRRCAGDAGRGIEGQDVVSPDGARPAGRSERPAIGHDPLRRHACAETRGARDSICRGPTGCPPAIASSAGSFWPPVARGVDAGISLEDGIAETLGVKLGDALTFDVGGNRVTAKVSSLRKVDWDSFRVNFFALFAPGPLDAMPTTYISAFRAPEGTADGSRR